MYLIHEGLADAILLLSQGMTGSSRPEDQQLAGRYLSALAPLLASAVTGKDILRDLDGFERMLGQTWLIDPIPFEPALAKWREFRDAYESHALGAMTVHERLSALGLGAAYERAKTQGDVSELRRILLRVRVDLPSIEAIVQRAGNPAEPR